MILAAGRGSRLQPLTDVTPKPLLRVGKYSLVEHLIFSLKKNGFQDLVINIAHLGDQIKNTLQEGQSYGVKITYSDEMETGCLETGGGIFRALPLLGNDPFLVVSGDIWTDYPFRKLAEQTFDSLAHLVLVDNPPYHAQGDFNLMRDRIVVNSGVRLTFGNIGVYHPNFFSNCTPGFFRLGPLLHQAAERNLITGEHFQGNWVNVGTLDILKNLQSSQNLSGLLS